MSGDLLVRLHWKDMEWSPYCLEGLFSYGTTTLKNMLFKCIYSDIIQYLNRSHADPEYCPLLKTV